MTYETFWIEVVKAHQSNKSIDDQRLGQRYFNTLATIRPDIANALRGNPLDPFHENKVEIKTHDWVAARWAI